MGFQTLYLNSKNEKRIKTFLDWFPSTSFLVCVSGSSLPSPKTFKPGVEVIIFMWMAWRFTGKKTVCATLSKTSNVTSHVVVPRCTSNHHEWLKSLPLLVGQKQGYNLQSATRNHIDNFITGGRFFVRTFHGSHESLAKKNNEEAFGLKTRSSKGKFKRRPKVTEAPVDSPYVPPRLKRAAKSSPDKTIEIFEGMTILELSKRCGESILTVQQILVNVGEKVDSEFDPLSIDIAELVAMEVGVNVRRLHSNIGTEVLPRPPVVTVMGHVDHGKTSLLDALRQTAVAASEAGGITQHLGAFVVGMQSGAAITFLDTPGHAAFSAMRARGAAVTDIVVLVVAADDGVMPQTLEAISHAKAAGVSIVVAINKCDKPAANPEKVKTQLAAEGLPLEEIGGDIQVVEVSAMKKSGLDKLEEALLLQAEMMELKARIDGPAQAYVVEARLDKGRGPLATAIVKAGTLLSGQHVVVGAEWGRIRAIRDMVGKLTNRASPAMPVEIEGLKGLPMAGDDIVVVESEERARMLSEGRKKKLEKDRLMKLDEERLQMLEEKLRAEEEEAEDKSERKKAKKPMMVEMAIVVKSDVQGTVQAVIDALKTLTSPQVLVKIIHGGVGPINDSDVDLAQACGACIIGFNVPKPPNSTTQAATQAGIKVRLHRVIYHLLEDIGNLIVERAPGTFETQVAGEAEVLNIFEIKGRSKAKGQNTKIAGCRVVDGCVTRACTMRLLRSGDVLYEGDCSSLKRETQDVETVAKGSECGLVLHDWCDFRVGDVIQCLEQVNRKPKFISSESGAVRIEC
ncbi:translation initiation factor [Lithospermum erythrorhizon]|uniref:Translation initiation factor IF-2, mitochondrial n=1 Tax=Lithospermum erythrorhizon TaxID=34254 RepID=A0AAV3PAF8_LITER